jgi:predicted SAM-dependent methyltransferase
MWDQNKIKWQLNSYFSKPMQIQWIEDYKFDDGSIEEVLAYHILEHFCLDHANGILNEWKRVLKDGGVMYLIVPDVDVFTQRYVTGHFSLGQLGWGLLGHDHEDASTLDTHKVLYTEERLAQVLFDVGFSSIERVKPLDCPQASDADWQLCFKVIK